MDAKTLLKHGGAAKAFASAVVALLPPSAAPDQGPTGVTCPSQARSMVADIPVCVFKYQVLTDQEANRRDPATLSHPASPGSR